MSSSGPSISATRRWAIRVLPLLPISLALAAPLVARQFQSPPVPAATPLEIGVQAPDFSLRDGQAKEGDPPVSLSQLASRGPVVIVFHRGLSCPICVNHLEELGDHIAEFKAAGIAVVAIGPDSVAVTHDSAQSFDPIPFPLLSDPDDAVARAFALETPDGGFFRGTFVVDRDRRVLFAGRSDAPVGDAETLLKAARQ